MPQALATFEMPVLLSGKIENVKRRLYILADGWDPSPFRYFAKKYTGAPGWEVIKLPSGHDVMVDQPNELAMGQSLSSPRSIASAATLTSCLGWRRLASTL